MQENPSGQPADALALAFAGLLLTILITWAIY
jgi:hypothetical protein